MEIRKKIVGGKTPLVPSILNGVHGSEVRNAVPVTIFPQLENLIASKTDLIFFSSQTHERQIIHLGTSCNFLVLLFEG